MNGSWLRKGCVVSFPSSSLGTPTFKLCLTNRIDRDLCGARCLTHPARLHRLFGLGNFLVKLLLTGFEKLELLVLHSQAGAWERVKQRLSNIWERCGLTNLRILNGSGFEIAIMGSLPQKHPPPLWERRLRRDFEVGRAK